LRHFAESKGIHYPLLSDPDSRVIRAFDILNQNFPPGHPWYGVPFPGMYIIDERGIVRAKYFEEDHRERYTASYVVTRLVDGGGHVQNQVETKHLTVVASSSDSVAHPGDRVRLILDVELKPGMHVYSPGVQSSYIPIDWQVPESKAWLAHPATYPPSKSLHLPAIRETVPVYQGRFRLARDLTIGQNPEVRPLLSASGDLIVEGALRYQACDDKTCYPPQTVPLKWTFRMQSHDGQRAPVGLQRKSGTPS
jgi:hypothetical protein